MDFPRSRVPKQVACPLCGSSRSNARELRGYWLHVCAACGHWFVGLENEPGHVERTYNDAYFAGDPGGYVDYLGEERQQRFSGVYFARLLARRGARKGLAIDVGCAAGFQAAEFIRQGWQVDGIEPNALMAEHARRNGVALAGGDVEMWRPGRSYDAALILQVISHLRDPAAAIEKTEAALRPGGWLVVETWDRDSWAARLQGDSWHELNPPSVLHWFSRRSLAALLRQKGFAVVGLGLAPKRIAIGRGARMIGHMSGNRWWSRLATASLSCLPRGLVVPYFLGDAFWMLARKAAGPGNAGPRRAA